MAADAPRIAAATRWRAPLAVLVALALAGCGAAPAATARVQRWLVAGRWVRVTYADPPRALAPTPLAVVGPAGALEGVRVEAYMTTMSMPHVRLMLARRAPGRFAGRMVLPMGGAWVYVVRLRLGARTVVRRLKVWADG
jgi:hypothetical protein